MVPHPLRIWSTSCLTVLAICVALAPLSACKRSEEAPAPPAAPQTVAFHVTRVDVGNAIGADNMPPGGEYTFRTAGPGPFSFLAFGDSGAGTPGQRGFGNDQLRARLRTLYGDRAQFALESGPSSGVIARIVVPVNPAPERFEGSVP